MAGSSSSFWHSAHYSLRNRQRQRGCWPQIPILGSNSRQHLREMKPVLIRNIACCKSVQIAFPKKKRHTHLEFVLYPTMNK